MLSHRNHRLVPSLALAVCTSCGGMPNPGFLDEALCPAPTVVEGIDVSEFQGTVNWGSVKGSGRGFAIARVSDGTGHPDPTFKTNWAGIKSAGMVRGVYQFFEPGEDPTAQADLLISAVGLLADGDLPAVADVEVTGGQSASIIISHLQTWLDKVKAGTGKTPMIYTAPGWWASNVSSSAFGADNLWVANWGVTCPSLPSGWSSFEVWQYADNGTVPGISGAVDLDRFNGTAAQLASFAGAGTAPTWAAKYVSQTWPLATTTIPMTAGDVMQASIVLKNVGSGTWDSKTKLGTTQPRDRTSPFADGTWLGPNRLAAVTGTVPPGGTYEFKFEFQAPAQPGAYDEFYGVVEEGVAWFSDPAQGGPPDNDIEAKFQIAAGAPRDMTAPLVDASAPAIDASTIGDAAKGRTDLGGLPPGFGATTSGCSCAIGGRAPSPPIALLSLLALVLLGVLRSRRR